MSGGLFSCQFCLGLYKFARYVQEEVVDPAVILSGYFEECNLIDEVVCGCIKSTRGTRSVRSVVEICM